MKNKQGESKMKIKKWIAVVSVCAFGQFAFAQAQTNQEDVTIQPGVYYQFTRSVAAQLKLDYDAVLTISRLNDGENLVVKKDEVDGEIDLSIFDNAQFASARMDILSK